MKPVMSRERDTGNNSASIISESAGPFALRAAEDFLAHARTIDFRVVSAAARVVLLDSSGDDTAVRVIVNGIAKVNFHGLVAIARQVVAILLDFPSGCVCAD